MLFCNTDVPVSFAYRNDNCCDTDVSFFIGLCLWVHWRRHVLLSPTLFFFSCAHSCRQLHSFSNAGGPQRHGISTTKFNNPASIQLNRIEVAVEVDCEQHQSTSSADSQLDNKLHQLKFGGDLESAMGEPSSKIDY